MKLIHLSDLHLGKRLGNFSFYEDQDYILKRILQIIDDEKPDAVMIAGDVYDKSVPSGEAVQLLDSFLHSLAKRSLPTLIISGNHDSAERLSFGGRLLERAGVYLSPVYDGKISPVTLHDRHGDVHFWLLPFLKPAHVRRSFPEETVESYTDALGVAIREMCIDPAERNVLLTHQFVTGGETCDSEEQSVGGSDNVDAAVFADFDYVALGHLHGPQNIGDHRIRYCGTPLKYSFSEEKQFKSVTVVKLEEKGNLQLQTVPLLPKRDLRSICGSFRELLDPALKTEDYIHIILTDEDDIPEAMGQLRVIYPNLVLLSYDNTRTRSNQLVGGAEEVQRKTPLALFEELFFLQNNRPMSDEQRSLAQEIIEAVQEGSL
ncbi:MAG: exonuclease SbcCD subunit D [Oscillospiraceae bacterium]|nr:exonuclease SbcCD subunit D [Oscillospiraceae bacterium]